ncbi:MAG: hypothetical protein P8M21_04165 [Halioglobus sp.]|nr:hypothetical protein [Halieaceae bacterium]MDG2411018.1 hypothetical protein [Halioglobus sp.]
MHQLIKRFTHILPGILAGCFALTLATLAQAAHHEGAEPAATSTEEQPSGRAVAIQLEAVVTAIDLDTREVSLQGPDGQTVTVTAREQITDLENVSVGDRLLVTYLAALEGEVRAPTEEELAEPWLVLEESSVSDDPDLPGVAGARIIRAVVTIEGMNREFGIVTVKDSRGKLHMIGDVEPEKMEGVTLGQTVVLVYTEALAMSIEKTAQAPE